MADINRVILVGRLTRNAELKYTNNGSAVSKFGIAINQRRKKDDQWVDEAHFFDVVVWGKTAESLSQYLVKGKQVGIEGQLRQDRWEQEGQARSKVEIVATNVMLLGTGTGAGSRPASPGPGPEARSSGSDSPEGGAPAPDNFEDDIPF
ncbi:MAG: single-stranded DNA-binding protein [Spirochaetia bacterium]|jgi:single-strand DNA-binding protein